MIRGPFPIRATVLRDGREVPIKATSADEIAEAAVYGRTQGRARVTLKESRVTVEWDVDLVSLKEASRSIRLNV